MQSLSLVQTKEMGENLRALYNTSNSSVYSSGKFWGGRRGDLNLHIPKSNIFMAHQTDVIGKSRSLASFSICTKCKPVFNDISYPETLQLFAAAHGKHCGLQHICLNVPDSLPLLDLFSFARSSEIKSLRESGPDLMCLAVPSNKSSFLQTLLVSCLILIWRPRDQTLSQYK